MERRGSEWSGSEWKGPEWSGAERIGVEWNGEDRSGMEYTRTVYYVIFAVVKYDDYNKIYL